jgi:hypothetical protein
MEIENNHKKDLTDSTNLDGEPMGVDIQKNNNKKDLTDSTYLDGESKEILKKWKQEQEQDPKDLFKKWKQEQGQDPEKKLAEQNPKKKLRLKNPLTKLPDTVRSANQICK